MNQREKEVVALQYYYFAASCELEQMKKKEKNNTNTNRLLHPMPPTCYELIRSLPGNDACIDCGKKKCNPDWATVSYGALVCMNCSGNHRSYGVQYSKVRSLTMDHWTVEQILVMLEGGNDQLHNFFDRHQLTTEDDNNNKRKKNRYFTKAAKFYRVGMTKHIEQILTRQESYRGREVSRMAYYNHHSSSSSRTNNNNKRSAIIDCHRRRDSMNNDRRTSIKT